MNQIFANAKRITEVMMSIPRSERAVSVEIAGKLLEHLDRAAEMTIRDADVNAKIAAQLSRPEDVRINY